MPARRCSSCGINYPDVYSEFKQCLKCDGKTDSLSNANPISESEVKHLRFERYFADWDEKRIAQETTEEERQLADLEAAVEAAPSIPDPPGAIGLERLPEKAKADEKPESG